MRQNVEDEDKMNWPGSVFKEIDSLFNRPLRQFGYLCLCWILETERTADNQTGIIECVPVS